MNLSIVFFYSYYPKNHSSIGRHAIFRRTRPTTPERRRSPSPILRPVRCSTPVPAKVCLASNFNEKRCTTPDSTIVSKLEMESVSSTPGISVRNTLRAVRCKLSKSEDALNASQKLVVGMTHKYSQMKLRAQQERKEKNSLAARVSELENALKMMSFSTMHLPGSAGPFHSSGLNAFAFMPSSIPAKKESESIESIEIPIYLK